MIRCAWVIAKSSFLEILREKVFYNTLFFALIILAMGYLASRLTFVHQDRIIEDLGLAAVHLSSLFVSVFSGSVLISRELQRRTIVVYLSKPISTMTYILGKFLGLGMVAFVNWAMISLLFVLILSAVGGQFTSTLFWALVLLLLQSWLVGVMAATLSCVSTAALSALMVGGIYLIGNNISQILYVTKKTESVFLAHALKAVTYVVPNLENFDLSSKVTYHLEVPNILVLTTIAYAVVLIGLSLLLSTWLLKRREF